MLENHLCFEASSILKRSSLCVICKNQLNRITNLLSLDVYRAASDCNICVRVQRKPLGKCDCNLVTNGGRSAVCVG